MYDPDEQIRTNKLKDTELIQLFNKVQQLKIEYITSIKTMLRDFLFQNK